MEMNGGNVFGRIFVYNQADLTPIVFFFYHGSQWGGGEREILTFFQISPIMVWNIMRVSK